MSPVLILCLFFFCNRAIGDNGFKLEALVRDFSADNGTLQSIIKDDSDLLEALANSMSEKRRLLELQGAQRTTEILLKSFRELSCQPPWQFVPPGICLYFPGVLKAPQNVSSDFCQAVGGELPLPKNKEEAASMMKFARMDLQFPSTIFWLNMRRASGAMNFVKRDGGPVSFFPPWHSRYGKFAPSCGGFDAKRKKMMLRERHCYHVWGKTLCQKPRAQKPQSFQKHVLLGLKYAVQSIKRQLPFEVQEKCESPWRLVRPNFCLLLPEMVGSWSAAFNACRTFGGTLTSPESSTQGHQIANLVRAKDRRYVWINILHDRKSSQFVTTEGLVPKWTVWSKGYPKNQTVERCVVFDTLKMEMYDNSCRNLLTTFLCRKNAVALL